VKSEVKRIPFDEQCPDRCAIGPAGQINSNVADMSRYLLFHLNKGKLEGKVLLWVEQCCPDADAAKAIQGAPDYKEESETSYRMGFFISAYRGHKHGHTAATLMGSALHGPSCRTMESVCSCCRTSTARRCWGEIRTKEN
jgi:hypothetical protein